MQRRRASRPASSRPVACATSRSLYGAAGVLLTRRDRGPSHSVGRLSARSRGSSPEGLPASILQVRKQPECFQYVSCGPAAPDRDLVRARGGGPSWALASATKRGQGPGTEPIYPAASTSSTSSTTCGRPGSNNDKAAEPAAAPATIANRAWNPPDPFAAGASGPDSVLLAQARGHLGLTRPRQSRIAASARAALKTGQAAAVKDAVSDL